MRLSKRDAAGLVYLVSRGRVVVNYGKAMAVRLSALGLAEWEPHGMIGLFQVIPTATGRTKAAVLEAAGIVGNEWPR